MHETAYLASVIPQFKRLKALADGALAQLSDDDFHRTLDDDANSVAILVKHLAGNMRSRWTDFLTTDGEKRDRDRDVEFEITKADDRSALETNWESGWSTLFATLETLTPDDVMRTVTIRGEAHTVLEAIQRQLGHYSYHIGQIVFLARNLVAREWHSLSIPKRTKSPPEPNRSIYFD